MREFYVNGFKSRDEYTQKSARSYDDERRRLESWLGGYMRFRQGPDGKNTFLAIDSRAIRRDPLYAAWKAKSFTDGDITLHFILFDILRDPGVSLTLNELMGGIDGYLASFREPKAFDESTVRKKLQEYVKEGVVTAEKKGRAVYYARAEELPVPDGDVLDFFSEAAPLGVIGSFLLDRLPGHESCFAFKHHYITSSLDSEVVCALLDAMAEKKSVAIETVDRRRKRAREKNVVPLRIMISSQSGRQYLMAYAPGAGRIASYRTDSITSVRAGAPCEEFDALRRELCEMEKHMWGVSTQGRSGRETEHVEFTVRYESWEAHIPGRLEREKRCGTVERLDGNTSRFSADVYDAQEMVPWIRTFICRITGFACSNREIEKQFRDDLRRMYALYGLEGGDGE